MTRRVLGLDIGGANLKASLTDGTSRSVPFPLWREPNCLADRLSELRESLPATTHLAVTMTGELCDCFASKREGVNRILDAVEQVAQADPVAIWTTDGAFVDVAQARAHPLTVASANWHALATYAGRFVPPTPALLLDLGTTTTDILPLRERIPVTRGRTDPDRLHHRELVYRGWKRTPLCTFGLEGHAAELFATTHDVYLVLGRVSPAPDDHETADGQPATEMAAHRRLARMICADLDTCDTATCKAMAREYHSRLCAEIARAIQQVSQYLEALPSTILTSGSGEFLLPEILACAGDAYSKVPIVSLGEKLGKEASTAACAHALAILYQERLG